MLKNLQKKINNKWFYTEMPWWGKILLIYVRGDLFMIFPLLLVILIIGLFSFRYALLSFGLLIVVRQSGELVYWLLQQFGDRKYRPSDFGFSNLDNSAIYILYQTFAIVGIVTGLLLVLTVVK
ncbi:hypothetical protein IPM65_05430 [Candidatus Roizmanbacteria bacterium]|nr:MAG: hypothetical protein IPM65_05430 [Candidatus Roizmanbacteria bacterium]